MRTITCTLASAALLGGAAALFPWPAQAGSCCGGGGGTALVLPRSLRAMVDLSGDWEKYDGYWNEDGEHVGDPPGSDLNQYRLTAAYGQRLAPHWQAGLTVPYVWNDNEYSGTSSRTRGLGDSTLGLWYEALDERSAWKFQSLRDLTPSVTVGPSLVIPTGVSPYDDVDNSFDVTGRGFYRLDGNLLVEKTFVPWSASASLSYGAYFERSVNREYGKDVEPYRKRLGNRTSASVSLGYQYFVGSGGDSVTAAGSLSHLREEDGTIDGERDPTTGFRKTSAGATLTYASTDHDWSIRVSWSHAFHRDGWGENFPTTDTYTLGVRHGFR